jgi:geranylgeranyl diphosphate synthase type I
MRCASSIGALAVGADQQTVKLLADFGDHLGLAFQLVDDLLGIWGSPAVTGKARLADLRCRKKSLPVVAALNSGTEAGKTLRELYFRPDADDDALLARMAELIEEAGGLKWAEDEADRHVRIAQDCLDGLSGAPVGVIEALRATAAFVTRRDR